MPDDLEELAAAAAKAWREHEAECRRLEAEYEPKYKTLAEWYQRIVDLSLPRRYA